MLKWVKNQLLPISVYMLILASKIYIDPCNLMCHIKSQCAPPPLFEPLPLLCDDFHFTSLIFSFIHSIKKEIKFPKINVYKNIICILIPVAFHLYLMRQISTN